MTEFQKHNTLQAVKDISLKGEIGNLNTIVFDGGEWVAIAWHSIHDLGGEWDGSVLLDSDGNLHWSDYHFCGYEGFSSQFLKVPASSLKQFYKRLKPEWSATPESKISTTINSR